MSRLTSLHQLKNSRENDVAIIAEWSIAAEVASGYRWKDVLRLAAVFISARETRWCHRGRCAAGSR